MYRENNPLATALNYVKQENSAPNQLNWNVFRKISDRLFILYKSTKNKVIFSPLYIHTFNFAHPLKLTVAEKFLQKYKTLEEIPTTAEKLKYLRIKKSLLQREVAEFTGINESTYIGYENPDRDYYPIDKMRKIAEFYNIDIENLLDSYNLFLYNGQGKQIKKLRTSLGLTQYEFGKLLGVKSYMVKNWESEKVRICKSSWVKISKTIELSHN